MTNMKFPNGTMQTDWYNGHTAMRVLNVVGGHLHTITPFAFNSSAFESLMFLQFISLQAFEFSFQSWPLPLFSLRFENCLFRRVTKQLLSGFSQVLHLFSMTYMPDDADFTQIFRSNMRERYIMLETFEIRGAGGWNATRSLNNLCLPRLPRVASMRLNYCGIERIHRNTFEFIGKTLTTLDIQFNKMKTVSIGMFPALFDVPAKHEKLFLYFHNPLECTCELEELRNFTYLNQKKNYLSSCRHGDLPLKCENLQTISKEKLLSDVGDRDGVYVFALSKVNVRVSDGRLMANTAFPAKFRLLIIRHRGVQFQANAKCPTSGWIRESVKCLVLRDGKQTIPIESVLHKSELTTIGVILTMLNKQIWPLHLQTYRRFDVVDTFSIQIYQLVVVINLVCVGLLLIVLLGMKCCRKLSRSDSLLLTNREQLAR